MTTCSAIKHYPVAMLAALTVMLVAFYASAAGPTARTVEVMLNQGIVLNMPTAVDTVFLANPEVADVSVQSPTVILIQAKTVGDTTLYALSRGRVITKTPIHVTHNIGRADDAIKALYPNSRVKISSVDTNMVIDGSVPDPIQANTIDEIVKTVAGGGKIINRLGVTAPTQVMLKVKIVEVSKNVDKRFGINLGGLATWGSSAIGFATLGPPGAVMANGVTQTLTGASSGVGGYSKFGDVTVGGILDMMEREGVMRTLAEPNLTAANGQPASFLAGGEFPIPVPQGDNQVTIQFKKYGVSLEFTPTILSGARISMNVRPEVSELSAKGAITFPGSGGITGGLFGTDRGVSVPALVTRRAQTTVELGNGQSLAIGGLLSTNSNHDVNKFPLLGDLPILGVLFKSDNFQKNETELVIIVTPYLVRPSNGVLSTPADGFNEPNDLERLFGVNNGWKH